MSKALMAWIQARTRCAGLLLCAWLAACQGEGPERTYEEQLAVCDLAQANGVLDEAVIRCTAAMDALEAMRVREGDARAAGMALRLASLERQRGRYPEGLDWLQVAERRGADPVDTGLERALALGGQQRWEEGAAVLDALYPAALSLEGDRRRMAHNVFTGFARRFDMLGNTDTAARLHAGAARLATNPPPPGDEGADP